MSNKTDDILKYIAQIVLPALGTLYFALAGTLAAIDTFMGAMLKISSNAYYAANADDNVNYGGNVNPDYISKH